MLDTYFTNKQIGEDKMADLRDTALSIIEKDNIGGHVNRNSRQ